MIFSSRPIAEEEFLRLLDPLLPRLSRYCRAQAVDPDDAKDLMSETILLAFQSSSKLRNPEKFQSYLFSIATRLHRRQHKRRSRFERLNVEEHDRAISTSVESAVDVQLLYHALQELPEKQREAIILFEISGLSLEEVREIQGGSLSGVKTRLARGREQLARSMGVRNSARDPKQPTEKPSRSKAHSLAYSIEAKL